MKIIKTILSIGMIAFLLYLFTFYMEGKMGIILIAFMIIPPIVSLFFALYARNRVTLTFSSDAYVNKGKELEVTVRLEKNGAFPLAIVEFPVLGSAVFSGGGKRCRLSIFSDEPVEYRCRLKAEYGGNGEVSIGEIRSCGFLGFMSFRVKTVHPEPISVGVIPDIPEINASTQLFRSISDIVLTSDEDEENDTTMLFSANTSPGYEHREYVQGDPLKRVNWKLSSKKRKLMVRLDEAASTVQPLIVLDLYRRSSLDELLAIKREETTLRSVFGLLSLMVRQGIACTFLYRNQSGEVVCESVDNPDYPVQLLLRVLAAKVRTDSRISLSGYESSACACVVATTETSGDFSDISDKITDKEAASIIVPEAEQAVSVGIPMWYLDIDNNFRMV